MYESINYYSNTNTRNKTEVTFRISKVFSDVPGWYVVVIIKTKRVKFNLKVCKHKPLA